MGRSSIVRGSYSGSGGGRHLDRHCIQLELPGELDATGDGRVEDERLWHRELAPAISAAVIAEATAFVAHPGAARVGVEERVAVDAHLPGPDSLRHPLRPRHIARVHVGREAILS